MPAELQAQVRHAVAPLRGSSLLAVDGAALERRVEALPTVLSAHYDRAFPHTLRLHVVPETPVAVLHRGTETWLVSARGRVMGRIPNGTNGGLARIWVKRATPVDARRDPRRRRGRGHRSRARARGALPGPDRDGVARPRRARLPPSLRRRAPARRADRRPPQARDRAPRAPRAAGRRDVRRCQCSGSSRRRDRPSSLRWRLRV